MTNTIKSKSFILFHLSPELSCIEPLTKEVLDSIDDLNIEPFIDDFGNTIFELKI